MALSKKDAQNLLKHQRSPSEYSEIEKIVDDAIYKRCRHHSKGRLRRVTVSISDGLFFGLVDVHTKAYLRHLYESKDWKVGFRDQKTTYIDLSGDRPDSYPHTIMFLS